MDTITFKKRMDALGLKLQFHPGVFLDIEDPCFHCVGGFCAIGGEGDAMSYGWDVREGQLLVEYLLEDPKTSSCALAVIKKITRDSYYQRHEECLQQSAEEKKKQRAVEGYVYIIKSAGIYKIGRCKSTKSRFKTYKTENPHPIKIILQEKVSDYMGVEDHLLGMFKDKKVRGEWFKLDKNDLEKAREYLSSL
jgi:hypothetical protein